MIRRTGKKIPEGVFWHREPFLAGVIAFFFLNILWLLLWYYFLINHVSTVRGRYHVAICRRTWNGLHFAEWYGHIDYKGTPNKSHLHSKCFTFKVQVQGLELYKEYFNYRHSLLFSVQMIQEQIWVLLLIIYSCPTNIPCECISDYRWFMNYSTIFDYMLLSRLWLTFTKQTAVVAKTLLLLLPLSQLFVTDPLPEILAPVPDTAKPAAPQLLQFIIWRLTAKQLLLLS